MALAPSQPVLNTSAVDVLRRLPGVNDSNYMWVPLVLACFFKLPLSKHVDFDTQKMQCCLVADPIRSRNRSNECQLFSVYTQTWIAPRCMISSSRI